MYYFYKDTKDLFHVGDDILPAGKFILKIYSADSIIEVEVASTHKSLLGPIEVTNVLKEDDTTYADLSELLTAVADFF